MLKSLAPLLVLLSFHAEAISCKAALSPNTLDLMGFYQHGTPVFKRDSQVVAKVSLSADLGGAAYARKGPVGPATTLAILSFNDSKKIIQGLDYVIHVGELNLFMNLIYKIYQLYMMSEKNYRNFLFSTYGGYFKSGWLQRKWSVLEQVLDHYGVIRTAPDFIDSNSFNWVTPKSLKRHYRKHVEEAKEFSFETPAEYETAAIEFWKQKNFVTLTLSPSDGHFIRYNYMTYEFSVIRGGKIITYFRMTEEYRLENEFDAYIASDLLNRE